MRTPNSDLPDAPGPDRDEFDLIDALRARFAAAGPPLGASDLGIGDDAAVVGLPGAGRVVLATDLVVGGVHVDLRTSSPEDVGWKALMVAVSDLGAMGCEPSHVLLSVAAPAGFPVERLGDGVADAAAVAGCAVVGGDLSSSPATLVVSVTAVGPEGDGSPPLRRSGARPGDRLLVTGPLGASAAGLRLLSAGDGRPVPDVLAAAHRRPVARLREGVVARGAGAVAAVDVSDGLATDVVHLAGASGVGLDLALDPAAVAGGATGWRRCPVARTTSWSWPHRTPTGCGTPSNGRVCGPRSTSAAVRIGRGSGSSTVSRCPPSVGTTGSEVGTTGSEWCGMAGCGEGSVPGHDRRTGAAGPAGRTAGGRGQAGKERIGRLVTLPDRMHDVQTFSRLGAPSTTARTFWMLGSQRRFVRRWEWLMFIPNDGFLPQTSHTAAMSLRLPLGTSG